MKSVNVFDIVSQPVLVSRESARSVKSRLATGGDAEGGPLRLDFSGAKGVAPSFLDEALLVAEEFLAESGQPNTTVIFARPPAVDTGSSYTVLGEDLLTGLGIYPFEKRQFQLGDDRMVEYDIGEARLRLGGSAMVTPVVFGPAGVSPLLGAVSLQIFGLIADSDNERLIQMPPIRVRPV